jgi:hypothetical protein
MRIRGERTSMDRHSTAMRCGRDMTIAASSGVWNAEMKVWLSRRRVHHTNRM